jgi:hypothetical protein
LHPDIAMVLRGRDLSALPQVVAALAAQPGEAPPEAKTFGDSISGSPVLSVHAAVPSLGWRVFVELPVAEARTAVGRARPRRQHAGTCPRGSPAGQPDHRAARRTAAGRVDRHPPRARISSLGRISGTRL